MDQPGTKPIPKGAVVLASLVAMAYACCGIARFRTYTNQTFDLAFYARMAWGMARGDFWDPILGASDFGLHLSPVLVPIGWLGALLGTPVALYLAQGLSVAAATIPLARLGALRFGTLGGYAGALALVLHPNVGHVIAYEAHPGTLALLPLAMLAYAVVVSDGKLLIASSVFVLACREDLALIVLIAAVLAMRSPTTRRQALASFGIAAAWLGLFVLVLHPRFKPAHGSMEAHFGPWGRSVPEVLRTLATEPMRLVHHLGATKRLTYLPRVLAPLALLPLGSPRMLLLASPVLGVALVSFFSTTTRIDSHYLTPAVPILVVGAIEGAAAIARRWPKGATLAPLALLAASVLGTVYSGLFSLGFDTPAFVTPPASPRALDALVAEIPADASVEAPDPILPHVAERPVLHRTADYPHDDDVVVLDLSHRLRFAHVEDLLRTTEEPRVRAMLGRADYRVGAIAGPYVSFLRDGGDASARIDRVRWREPVGDATPLTACLGVARVARVSGKLAIDLIANGPCANDLAIRLATRGTTRVDLLFEGLVSPAHLRRGDVVRSIHDDPDPSVEVLRLGALRSSGARPEPTDPIAIELAIR